MSTAMRRGWRRREDRGWTAALLVATAVLVLAGCVNVQAGDGGFVMGGSIVVEEGEVAREDIVAIGGNIRIDGEARRDVVNIGGRLEIDGEVGRDVVSIGGSIRLGPDARVGRDVTVVAGGMDRSPGARIDGEFVNVSFGPHFGGFTFSPFWGGWWGMWPFGFLGDAFRLLYWLVLGLLTVALVGDRVSSASHALLREPLRLWAIGIVGFVASFPIVLILVILCAVLIGIPLLLAFVFAYVLAYIFGAVAVFQGVGGRVMRTFGRADASQLAIVVAGTVTVIVLRFIPVVGFLGWWGIVFPLALGSVLATRFGTNRPWLRRSVPPPPGGPQRPGGAVAPPGGAGGSGGEAPATPSSGGATPAGTEPHGSDAGHGYAEPERDRADYEDAPADDAGGGEEPHRG